mgnify:CR=1 FL=1
MNIVALFEMKARFVVIYCSGLFRISVSKLKVFIIWLLFCPSIKAVPNEVSRLATAGEGGN